jgi:aquaporin Z
MHSSNKIIFIAELIGTFVLVVGATGSIVYNEMLGGIYGIGFIAAGHLVALSIAVYAFGKYSMAHFNPAVTIAFFITKHVKGKQLPLYFTAQTIGAFLGSIFVLFAIGDHANLGTNYPNLISTVEANISYEILATIFLMGVIYIVVHFKKLAMLTGVAIGGIVAIDVLLFGEISGASMNPIRSLAPAVVSGLMIYHWWWYSDAILNNEMAMSVGTLIVKEVMMDLWLYLTTPFIGTIIVAVIYKALSGRMKNTSTH